jgi:4-diphosphocytidyl-2-C-methyl-D-erythritol kinase
MGIDRRTASVASPAKINLTLSITGKRPDGFHDLLSIVWQTQLGDQLIVSKRPNSSDRKDVLHGSYPGVPFDESNLVLKALRILRSKVNMPDFFDIELIKQIPPGSGLGGGSSNAVALLKLLAEWYPDKISRANLEECAVAAGSDCLLFLQPGPCLMSGRGDHCAALPESVIAALSGKPVWLIRPDVAVSTAEAFRRLAMSGAYTAPNKASQLHADWIAEASGYSIPLIGNDFEKIMPQWMPTFPLVLQELNRLPGTFARLSGSGSAIFCFPGEGQDGAIEKIIEGAWGESLWLARTMLI